ncbi:MAG: LacI family DNA-binding transcriptional regulator [Anaerolineae bacterium]
MGYSPNEGARSLVRGHTCTVGVVVTTIADPFSAEVVEGIESTAYAHGYSVILAASQDDPTREVAAVETLRAKRVDAIIVTSSRVGALHQERLGAAGVPVILLNSHSRQVTPHTFSVRVDDMHGGRLATEYLLWLGHRRIAHVAGPPGHSPSVDRLAGYRAALENANLAFDAALVCEGTGRPAGGEQALAQLLALAERPTAVFCYNDMTAIGLLRAARLAGLNVPRDLAVIGFDNIPFAAYVSPALTTIAQPMFEMGQRAMAMALSLMEGTAAGHMHDVVLEGRLIVRESTGDGRREANGERR